MAARWRRPPRVTPPFPPTTLRLHHPPQLLEVHVPDQFGEERLDTAARPDPVYQDFQCKTFWQ